MPDDTSGDTPHGDGERSAGSPRCALGDEIAILCARLDAGQYRLLSLLHRFDEAEGWSGWRTCADWLSWRTGMTTGPARERVRVAKCLASLPLISAEMEKGRLSWSKVRALTRIATGENEARLLELALRQTASQIEIFVRACRSAAAAADAWDDDSGVAVRRSLSVHVQDDGMYRVSGLLTPEVGTLLLKALDAAGDELYRAERAAERAAKQAAGRAAKQAAEQPDAPEPRKPQRTHRQRHHDALQAWLEGTTRAEVEVVVHSVAGAPDVVSTEEASHVPTETSQRLCCDAEAVQVTHAPDGPVLDVGRRRRTVNWRLRKALDVRDGGCRFPGCGLRYTQAHHVIPWADGGETALDNLLLLCRFHHRLVHEGGWRVEMEAGAARFIDPDGTVVPAVPPACEDVQAPKVPDAGPADWHGETGTTQKHGERLDRVLSVLWGDSAA